MINFEYTYDFSKYSCSVSFYYIHLITAYLVFLSGIACFITRIHSKLYFLHHWFGKLYILSMLYATASSLLIHNTGLPFAILISFGYVLVALTIGWILITIHKIQLNKKVLKSINLKIENNNSINQIINYNKNKIINKKTPCQKIFSLKTFHAIFMFLSWFNIAGRVFASDYGQNFKCNTYPFYKPGYLNNTDFIPVPLNDPNYNSLPWANSELQWGIYLSVFPILFAFIFGIIWIYIDKYYCNKLKIEN